jgi:hypothetical protein
MRSSYTRDLDMAFIPPDSADAPPVETALDAMPAETTPPDVDPTVHEVTDAPDAAAPLAVIVTPVTDDPIAALDRLTTPQRRVIEFLLAGHSIAATAALAAVSRTTVYRWLRDDALFKSVYAQWQQQAKQHSRARLLLMADRAVDVVNDALSDNDRAVAFRLLKNMGLMAPPE